jgi:phospholipid/cholesterol/gamma-HCH transport system substrate-binding protein
MGKSRTFESIVGVFVLIVAFFFFYYVCIKSGWQRVDEYLLIAKFDKADGLAEGGDVKVSGIKVGKIIKVSIDPISFLAVIEFTVLNDLKLPNDTSASVSSDGLLGKKYLSLTPGGNDICLSGGDEIENTSGPVDIESLIGKFVFSQNKGG